MGAIHMRDTQSDPIFVLKGTPSTPTAATSYPSATFDVVHVLQNSKANKSMRERPFGALKKITESNIKNNSSLMGCVDNEGRNGERSECRVGETFA
ncbi:hypothetical protein Tco_0322926 [Tanacetum coccineum]